MLVSFIQNYHMFDGVNFIKLVVKPMFRTIPLRQVCIECFHQ